MSLSPIDRMTEYKGTSLPNPVIPLTGLVFAVALPYVIIQFTPEAWSSLNPIEGILLLLQTFSLVSILFFSEFLFGTAARGASSKASFSPAAAHASGIVSFDVVQSNRIHQNHIESAFIYIPAALSATAAGADARVVVATSVTWVVSRACYRLGYTSDNPFWRLFGTVSSVTQSLLCWGFFISSKFQFK